MFVDLAKKEPVVLAGLVAAGLGWISSFVVLHGWLTATRASGLTQAIVPMAVAAATVLISVIVRNFVTPAISKVEGEIAGLVHKYVPQLDGEVKAVADDLNQALDMVGAQGPQPMRAGNG